MTFDIRALTEDQRSLAYDIASAMDFGHEDTCAVWWEDPDGCSCPLLLAVAGGLHGARIVEVTQEWGYDPATQRSHNGNASVLDPVACEVILRMFTPNATERTIHITPAGIAVALCTKCAKQDHA